MDEEELRFAADALRDADSVVAMTGAGVSTASGIPDFRGDDGLWQEHDPADFHVSRFETDPEGFWTDRLGMVEELYDGGVAPNRAHDALADLEDAGLLDALVTQNVDGLHQEAGHDDVIELHGNGQRVACRDCRQRLDAEPVRERVVDGELPPTCPDCEGLLKPDVVLFGEQLPEHALLRAHSRAEKADVFLVVGSSLSVEPAATLPETASGKGATLVIVNFDPTPLSTHAEYDWRADVTEALPRLRDAALEG
jgi:NAD-dependent deacetylase